MDRIVDDVVVWMDGFGIVVFVWGLVGMGRLLWGSRGGVDEGGMSGMPL
jgi:hypothetical protein